MGTRWAVRLVLVVAVLSPSLPAVGQTVECDGLAPTFTDGTDGDDVLVGTARSDTIRGGGGNDVICGGGGDDYIAPGEGADRVDGGGGSDLVEFSPGGPLVVDLGAGTASGEGGDELRSIENVGAGCSPHGDTLIGNAADNYLLGGAGADTIVGGDGADRLYGEEVSHSDVPPCDEWDGEADTIEGGPGDDVLFGQYGADHLDGSQGFDALHGGSVCRNGENNFLCDTEDPPPPPPVCSDGVDNDGSGGIDYGGDGGCAAPRDPTEDSWQDPTCFDGIDNDADGTIDFPAEVGCRDYDDGDEYFCPPPGRCTPEVRVTIRLSKRGDRFLGEVEAPAPCVADRSIRVYRWPRSGRFEQLDRARSEADGTWRSRRMAVTKGRYVAFVGDVVRESESGDVVGCTWGRSRPLFTRP